MAPTTTPETSHETKTQIKPLEEFRHFPELPLELRITIWKMAIQSQNIQGVHYFSLFKSTGDRKSPLLDLAVCEPQFTDYEKDHEPALLNIEYRASAPRVATQSSYLPQYSWFEGNQSLYLWDAGLFTACQESRQIITKFLKTKSTLQKGVFPGRYNGETVYLRSDQWDLFCFEFEHEDIEESMSIRWGILLSQLSLSFSVLSLSDIAFPFHPSWLDSLPEEGEPFDLHKEPSPRGLVARVFDAWCRRELPEYINIWLLDRSMQVRDEITALRYGPGSFSDLQHTYVGIKSWDLFCSIGKQKRERDTAFYLCKRLESRKDLILEAPPESCLGVLACLLPDKHDRS